MKIIFIKAEIRLANAALVFLYDKKEKIGFRDELP
jgi:hypothetical protein